MKTLAEYLELTTQAHGHLCAGQVLGVRLAMLGLRELGIDDPIAERKRLVTYVEIDRCVTDAVAVVANSPLGKPAPKLRDRGKGGANYWQEWGREGGSKRPMGKSVTMFCSTSNG